MKKQLREQMTVAEQKELLKGIIEGRVQTTLDIVNALPSDLKTSSKERLVAMFERALPVMSYVRKDDKYIGVFETPEQVIERLERAMNDILRRNKLNHVNVRHMRVEKVRMEADLRAYLLNGGKDKDHLTTVEKEIENIEKIIKQVFDDTDLMMTEYLEISSIKTKMVEILNEK